MPAHLRPSRCRVTSADLARRDIMRMAAALSAAATGVVCPALAADPDCVRIGGTGMALATMRVIGQDFTAGEPGTTVDVMPSLGTSGGLSALAAGAIDLALSARPLKDNESGKKLQSQAYARTPLAFVAHQSAAVDRITLDAVARIFNGDLTTWAKGGLIRLVRREPSDADWSLLRSLSPDMAQAVEAALQRPGLLTVATDQENGDALERMTGSFGMMSIGQLRAEARHLVPLALDGVSPEVNELAVGRYTLLRTLYIAWRGPISPKAGRFLAFLHSGQAASLLSKLGHIPLLDPNV